MRGLRAACGAVPERAPAARRRRNTPGGSPAQGASAPQPASRPEGEGRAGQGERARGEGAPGRPSSSRGNDRGSAGKTSHTKPIFCMTYLPYKISAGFCMTGLPPAAGARGGRAARLSAARPPRSDRANRGASSRKRYSAPVNGYYDNPRRCKHCRRGVVGCEVRIYSVCWAFDVVQDVTSSRSGCALQLFMRYRALHFDFLAMVYDMASHVCSVYVALHIPGHVGIGVACFVTRQFCKLGDCC